MNNFFIGFFIIFWLMEEKIIYFLEKIKDQLGSLRSKVSRILKELEQFIFEEGSFLSDSTIEILLFGITDRQIKGLLELCGISSKFGGNLKNSSFTAINLFWKLITESSNYFF